MLVVGRNGKGGLEIRIEEAQSTITTRSEDLGRVCFGVCDIVERVLSWVAGKRKSVSPNQLEEQGIRTS